MRSLEQLIEQEVKRWSLERRRPPTSHTKESPSSITISREFGSQGARLGELVAQQLGLAFFDQNLMHRLAEAAEAAEGPLSWIDERPRSQWHDFVDGILMGDRYTESEYLRRLVQVVREIDKQGGAVLVGRGSQYILAPSRALRVRVVAPLSARVASVAERSGVSEAEARRQIDKTDAERAAFMRHHFDRNLEDPASFDLTVNTGTMSVSQAAKMVAAAWGLRFPI